MSRPKFETEWDDFKGHVALTWDKLSDEELIRVQGNFADLVKMISDAYGEKKSAVEERVTALYDAYAEKKNSIAKGITDMKENLQHQSEEFVTNLKEKANHFQDHAKDRIRKIREESIDPAVQKSEDYIKMHPFTAVLGALGVGVLMGAVIGLLSRKD